MSVPQRRSLYDCLNDRLRADARLGLARDSAAMAGGAAGPLLYRDGREYISFMSNDGLGLAADVHWQARVAACFAAHAPSASASRLAGGRSDVVDQACRAVADYFGFAECLFLPSGYQANLACVTTLLQQGQEAFVDRRCHASVMRALPLAGARIRAWNHLDYDHLERLLSSLPPDAPHGAHGDGRRRRGGGTCARRRFPRALRAPGRRRAAHRDLPERRGLDVRRRARRGPAHMERGRRR